MAAGNYNETIDTKGFTKELYDLEQALEDMIASLVKTMDEANTSKIAAEKTMEATQEVGQTIAGVQRGTQNSISAVTRTAAHLEETTG